ncbi:MAG: DUF6585 family protein [Chloroflexota bacterium]
MPDDRPIPLTPEDRIEPHPALGEHIDNFPSRRMPPLLLVWGSLIAVSLLFNIATYQIDLSAYGPWIATVFGVAALGSGWWVMHLWNREVIMYKHGFTYREGSKNVPFRYVELAAIRLRAEQYAAFGGLIKRTVYRITLRTHAGDVIRLNNIYRRVTTLGDKLNQIITDQRRPEIQEALAAGEAVPFTDYLTLSSDGFTVRADELLDAGDEDAHLPWADYGGYNIAQRQLRLQTRDGATWFSMPLYEVDNLLLLIELLREHETPGEPAAQP